MGERRADLTGADRAVSEVLDEINFRMHGLISGGSDHRQFAEWLAEPGYQVVPIPAAAGGTTETGETDG